MDDAQRVQSLDQTYHLQWYHCNEHENEDQSINSRTVEKASATSVTGTQYPVTWNMICLMDRRPSLESLNRNHTRLGLSITLLCVTVDAYRSWRSNSSNRKEHELHINIYGKQR